MSADVGAGHRSCVHKIRKDRYRGGCVHRLAAGSCRLQMEASGRSAARGVRPADNRLASSRSRHRKMMSRRGHCSRAASDGRTGQCPRLGWHYHRSGCRHRPCCALLFHRRHRRSGPLDRGPSRPHCAPTHTNQSRHLDGPLSPPPAHHLHHPCRRLSFVAGSGTRPLLLPPSLTRT
jgi:hypothetical protein